MCVCVCLKGGGGLIFHHNLEEKTNNQNTANLIIKHKHILSPLSIMGNLMIKNKMHA